MNRLEKTIVLAGIGLAVGSKISLMINGTVDPFLSIAFMGVSSGWKFISRHIGKAFVFGSLLSMAFWLCIKFSLCLLIGWFVLGLDLLLSIIEICNGKNPV